MIPNIAEALVDWIGELLGVPTTFGEFPRGDHDSAMVKASPGDPVVSYYHAGGGVYKFPYEVYLRTFSRDEDDRISGIERLNRVLAAIERHEVPDVEDAIFSGHTCTQMPNLFRTESNGATTYQLTAYLTYIERS